MQRFDKSCLQFPKRHQYRISSPGVTFNLTCGKGVTELQNLTNLRLSSFAESHQMQHNNIDVYPKSDSKGPYPDADFGIESADGVVESVNCSANSDSY